MQNEWASWLVVLFFALLPFGRFAELPLSIFALSLPFVLHTSERRSRARSAALVLVPLFLCFWLPMVISSFDSFEPQKSALKSLAALRYLTAAICIATLLSPPSARWRVLRWTSFLLLFWAIDGFVQLFFGSDLFGIPMHPERLNALFIRQYQFFGPTLAILSPLLLEYARRRWPPWAWAASFGLVLGAVMVAGMRSGWLIMGLVMLVYLLQMMNRKNRELRLVAITIPVLSLGVIIAGYLASPLIQERVEQSLKAFNGTQSAVDLASSARVPIFSTAWRMYQAHPVNGVGVRAFSKAYLEFADEDDVHVRNHHGVRGAEHAHNLVMEVAADTGTVGLFFLVTGMLLAWRQWRMTRPKDRLEAFPYVLAIGLLLFPVNSHFAIYGTYLSSLIWILAGLWVASLRE